jgi:hypothetical protein
MLNRVAFVSSNEGTVCGPPPYGVEAEMLAKRFLALSFTFSSFDYVSSSPTSRCELPCSVTATSYGNSGGAACAGANFAFQYLDFEWRAPEFPKILIYLRP